MSRIAIIYKKQAQAALQKARELKSWLARRKRQSYLSASPPVQMGAEGGEAPPLAPETGLVVVLGGDGTMLAAVRAVAQAGLWQSPILGVNLGGLGYLTALAPEELYPALELVLAGDFQAPPRMMLRARVQGRDRQRRSLWALNDVVLNKAAMAPIMDIITRVDGRPLTTLRADGLIVASPTGSTAYNLSAGGPICHPDLNCILVTPICSFALSNRPLLLSPQLTLELSLGREVGHTTLTCDGQVGLEISSRDTVIIQRADESVRIINSPFRDYFEILRTKLRWG